MKTSKAKIKTNRASIEDLLEVMVRLRSPKGCPWDREQDHKTLRWHAVEEVYELMDAIEAGDDHEMVEELGDVLLQVVFHSQLGKERGAFDFAEVARRVTEKLIRRHPHVFGDSDAKTVDAVWAQWEKIKKAEKAGTKHERPSALDGIPKHLPALLRSEKLLKKARKAKLDVELPKKAKSVSRSKIATSLFELAAVAQSHGWSAEELLRGEMNRREARFRRMERKLNKSSAPLPAS